MPRDPLVVIILLLFLLLIAVLLTLWLALTSATRQRGASLAIKPSAPPKLAPSNDQVRGAKAPQPSESKQEDAFERFLRAKNDDLDF